MDRLRDCANGSLASTAERKLQRTWMAHLVSKHPIEYELAKFGVLYQVYSGDEAGPVEEVIAEVVEEEAGITVAFDERDDGSVVATFPSMNGSAPFDVHLQNMHWGLVEDLDQMGDGSENADILGFFREYVVGGPRAIPFRCTLLVFMAIKAYIERVSVEAGNA